jgi:hypothetical protein
MCYGLQTCCRLSTLSMIHLGDSREATAQLVTSATKLRISVEDRRLSLDVSGKSSSELQKRLDLCNKSIREARDEKDELDDSRSKLDLSIVTLELLMQEPGITGDEKRKIRSKLRELSVLQAKLKKRSDQLLYLLVDNLFHERETIEAQLKQLDTEKSR